MEVINENRANSLPSRKDLWDSGWTEDSFKSSSPNNFSPPHYIIAAPYSEPNYASMPANSYAIMSPNPASLPVPIPGNHAASPPAVEDLTTSPMQQPQCPAPMTIYPIYAMPNMYFICRDGSTVPVNVGAPWGTREGLNGAEVSPGVPSMYFNTPPTGISPPQMGPWIPATIANYGPTWTPAMSSAVAFTPPLEMSTYPTLVSPPWSPQSGIYIPPPTAVTYQVPPPPPPPPTPPPLPPMVLQEPLQKQHLLEAGVFLLHLNKAEYNLDWVLPTSKTSYAKTIQDCCFGHLNSYEALIVYTNDSTTGDDPFCCVWKFGEGVAALI
ncbi:uncharacterized protein TNCV_2451311 [Trichonephila clavipes]|nr:uncharacterized protein TNCV_2451311 [Trichonephila clavipes]